MAATKKLEGSADMLIAYCDAAHERAYAKSRETGHHGTRDNLMEISSGWSVLGERIANIRWDRDRTFRVKIGAVTYDVSVQK